MLLTYKTYNIETRTRFLKTCQRSHSSTTPPPQWSNKNITNPGKQLPLVGDDSALEDGGAWVKPIVVNGGESIRVGKSRVIAGDANPNDLENDTLRRQGIRLCTRKELVRKFMTSFDCKLAPPTSGGQQKTFVDVVRPQGANQRKVKTVPVSYDESGGLILSE